MKKSIKTMLIAVSVIGCVSLAQARVRDVISLCQSGSSGNCIFNPLDGPGYECLIPPGNIDNGDCKGMVDVVIP
ncbi:hypothetical protein [Pedobacter sp.]